MAINIDKFYEVTLDRVLEVADYQKAMCGKVENLGKKAQTNVDATSVHTALTYMDMFTQDFLMIPLFREFPDLVPCVEEKTGMKLKYQDNKSDDTLIIDPIDGTEPYCKGEKDYSILVGLLNKGKMVAAITCYPETKEVYAAIKGKGAWKIDSNGKKTDLPKLETITFDDKNVAAHYRFVKEPYNALSDRMKEKGYVFPINMVDFGTNLSGILRVADGRSCAFIGPHITLHDMGAPSLIIQELGGVVRVFDYDGKDDTKNWKRTDDRFRGLDPKGSNPRFRVIIANNDATADRILRDMYQ
jgi:fructose-1,6-bisphosphatase/inositol monophosphatase family enzyme